MLKNLMKNASELKRRMEDPNIETGDDMDKYAREVMIPEMEGKAKGREPLERNKAVLRRYRSYL